MPEIAGLSPAEADEVDFEIAAYEEERSLAHHMNSGGWPDLGIAGASEIELSRMAAQVRRYEMATNMFIKTPNARTATLGILRMRGNWHDDWMHQRLTESALVRSPYNAKVYDRDDPENKLAVDILGGIVSIDGITEANRRRLLLATKEVQQEFVAEDGRRFLGWVAIEVDKISTFALQIDQLKDIEPEAAYDVRIALVAGMIMTCNMARVKSFVQGTDDYVLPVIPHPIEGSHSYASPVTSGRRSEDTEAVERAKLGRDLRILKNAKRLMAEHGLAPDDVFARVARPWPQRLRLPKTIQQLEHAIRKRGDILVPVTTTFYGERIIRRLEEV